MNSVYYTSLSGMMAANYGLQNTSNNVANMESKGFKRSDVFYSSLGFSQDFSGLGSGVGVAGTSTNYGQGRYIDSESPTDLAVVGQGFFVVRMKNGELLYTRDGEFTFDETGYMVDRHSGGQVQGYDASGHLVSIKGKGPQTVPGAATHHVKMHGKWVFEDNPETNDSDSTTNPDPERSAHKSVTQTIDVYDEHGKKHELTLVFKAKNSTKGIDPTTWTLVSAEDSNGEYVDIDMFNDQIEFSNNNSGPIADKNTVYVTLNGHQRISINYGVESSGADTGVVLTDAKTNPTAIHDDKIRIKEQDGYGVGRQTDCSFDDEGLLHYHYDNGQEATGIHIALARFDDLQNNLIPTHGNMFKAKINSGIHYGTPAKNAFGTLQSKKLETSNVDPTAEFANIVVLQRMFQACSQIMDIDKQLLQELNERR